MSNCPALFIVYIIVDNHWLHFFIGVHNSLNKVYVISGRKYAMTIMKTIIAHCVRDLEFSSEADKLDFKVDVALRPTAGNLLQVKLRT